MAVDQLRLDFPLDELKRPRRRQSRPPATGKAPPPPTAGEQLMTAPVLQQCGFCGHRQTVAGETTLCDECGGIIMRDETAV